MSELEGLKLLRRLEEGVAGKTGDAFFRQIIVDLARALEAHAAFSSRLIPDRRAAMLAFWVDGEFQPCLEYSLAGTPCEFVYQGRIMSFARNIGDTFPVDREWFDSLGVKSYLGIPVKAESGEAVGHLAVMDTRERDWREADVDVLRLFSLRFAAELERSRYESELKTLNTALARSNERLSAEVEHRRAAEGALATAKAAADAANQAKSVFLTHMSHELRTPLNGLLGYAQLLERDCDLPASHRNNVASMRRCGEHLLTLINDVLDLARIESGTMTLETTPFDLRELLEGVVAMISIRAGQAGIGFRCVVDAAVPPVVYGDARRLRQVLLNLLGNAVKFTLDGEVVFTAAASACSVRSVRLHFSVRDTGPGIPAEQLARIFEPFHQVPAAGRQVEGTGLGLSISRAIVRSMNGRIDVTSEPGRGALFTVELDAELPAELRMKPARSERRITGYGGPRRRILVVDDEPHNRSVLRQLLEPLGFEVHECDNGSDALRLAASVAPDVILVDLVMPVMDGLTTLRELRSKRGLAMVPTIALSASAFAETVTEAQRAGASEFIAKPVAFDQLLDAIQRCIAVDWFEDGSADGSVRTGPHAGSSEVEFTIPADIARRLLDHAQSGDVEALGSDIEELTRIDDGLVALATRLRAMADAFDMKALRSLIGSAAQSPR